MKLEGALILVTGGASGLGLSIAKFLYEKGAKVEVADFDRESLSLLPPGLTGNLVDVTSPEQVGAWIRSILERHGRIDILVNNAGVIFSEPMINLLRPNEIAHSYERFRKSIVSNLDSVFIVTSAVVEQMVKLRIKGIIINISSISACGNEGQTAYSVAKAGVNAMTVTWSKELGKLGIRCNAISPGFIDTESTKNALSESIVNRIKSETPLRRLGEPLEVAKAVSYLIDNDFVNGAILNVDGGLKI